MDLLIDRHAVIWFITEDSKLPRKTKKLMEDIANNCFVSVATLWEIGIKNSLGRLDLHSDLNRIFQIIDETGFELLPITANHILEKSQSRFSSSRPLRSYNYSSGN